VERLAAGGGAIEPVPVPVPIAAAAAAAAASEVVVGATAG
jgi:hypothetical protein